MCIIKIQLEVKGKPPKKSGANSMWSQEKEIPLIIELRKQATAAMMKSNSSCFKRFVCMKFILKVPEPQIVSIGDLDNFIGGILDALQAAHVFSTPNQAFYHEGLVDINPKKPIIIDNDGKVVSIHASKEITGICILLA